MGNLQRTAGVIVLYNPIPEEVIANITSYLEELNILIVVDNSEHELSSGPLKDFFRQNKKIIYLPNKENLGIAKALNIGASVALNQGFKWLLTMDQDSWFEAGMFQKLCVMASKLNGPVAILSPQHLLPTTTQPKKFKSEYFEVESVMTSGNLLNLDAYVKAGPFEEKFFIDYVDHEYCLRLKKNGYKIWIVTDACLIHNLGNLKNNIFGIYSTNHSYVRRYYMTRNRLFVQKKYRNDFPAFCNKDIRSMWVELLKIVFMERQKLNKIKAFFLGYHHYKNNRFGKLNL